MTEVGRKATLKLASRVSLNAFYSLNIYIKIYIYTAKRIRHGNDVTWPCE